MRRWLVAPLLLSSFTLGVAVEEEEEGDLSCPATGGSAACRAAAGDAPPSRPVPHQHHQQPSGEIPGDSGLRADLVKQEVDELRNLIKLSKERISLLTDLKGALEGESKLPLEELQVRALQERLPLLSDIASDVERSPGATADDYLLTKTVIPSAEEVKFVKFIPLRNHKSASAPASSSPTSSTATPSALLAAVQADGAVQLFSPTGELVHSFSAGHEFPVTSMAVSPSVEENVLATSDTSGVIRLHKVNVRQWRAPKAGKTKSKDDEEKISQYLAPSLNVSAQLQRQLQMPVGESGEALGVTTLAFAHQGSTRYVLAGDEEGKVNVFLRNGTLRRRLDTAVVDNTPVNSLSSSLGGVVFRTGSEWGYIDMDNLQVKPVDCLRFNGRVEELALDPQQATRVLSVDENGTVWVFHVHNKKECRIEMRFSKGSTHGPIEIFPIKGFAIGLERGHPGEAASLVALNMSQPQKPGSKGGSRPPDVMPAPTSSAVVWRRPVAPIKTWSLLRRSKEGDLIALVSEDGREIEILEVLMNFSTPPPQADFGNFQMPVIGVTVVLVLGYQYMKQKGAASAGGGSSSRSGGGLGGLGGLGGGGGGLGKSNEDFMRALREKRKAAGKT